jgi:ADP-ribosyl-[dinitrogen reductase] hydrolase
MGAIETGGQIMNIERIQRARGALLGLAVGDAVGTTVEFHPRGSFREVSDMAGGGPFGLKPGQWTDDTSMALCLGASLVARGFDPLDQMRRYLDWTDNGYMSSTGRCFDIGSTVSRALSRFQQTGDPYAGSSDPRSAGNGCIMRLAPVPIRYLDDPAQAVTLSGEQSRTTHGAEECVAASRLFGEMLVRALNGADKEAVLAAPELAGDMPPKLAAIAAGAWRGKSRDQVKGSAYVVESLEASLWCFHHSDNFRDAVLLAANLGDDADTTAAITGQIAGAFYGEEGIPLSWREKLAMGQMIGQMAEALLPEAAAELHK